MTARVEGEARTQAELALAEVFDGRVPPYTIEESLNEGGWMHDDDSY